MSEYAAEAPQAAERVPSHISIIRIVHRCRNTELADTIADVPAPGARVFVIRLYAPAGVQGCVVAIRKRGSGEGRRGVVLVTERVLVVGIGEVRPYDGVFVGACSTGLAEVAARRRQQRKNGVGGVSAQDLRLAVEAAGGSFRRGVRRCGRGQRDRLVGVYRDVNGGDSSGMAEAIPVNASAEAAAKAMAAEVVFAR